MPRSRPLHDPGAHGPAAAGPRIDEQDRLARRRRRSPVHRERRVAAVTACRGITRPSMTHHRVSRRHLVYVIPRALGVPRARRTRDPDLTCPDLDKLAPAWRSRDALGAGGGSAQPPRAPAGRARAGAAPAPVRAAVARRPGRGRPPVRAGWEREDGAAALPGGVRGAGRSGRLGVGRARRAGCAALLALGRRSARRRVGDGLVERVGATPAFGGQAVVERLLSDLGSLAA